MVETPAEPIETSSAARWQSIARLVDFERRLGATAQHKGGIVLFCYEFVRFGLKQGWACLFGALLLALLFATHFLYPQNAILSRYDFLVLGALMIQIGMLVFRLETLEEAKIILIFHIVGTLMEIFKTSTGSWTYPEANIIRIAGVPLFSGFMYAAVGSYIARVWRLFDFEFTNHPPLWALSLLAIGIYLNFFADHYGYDFRLVLFVVVAFLFRRTWIHYRIWQRHRSMPLLLGLLLVALFIWFGENIGSFSHAWIYPNQKTAWALVPVSKISAWFLLMLISYTLVALVHSIRVYRDPR